MHKRLAWFFNIQNQFSSSITNNPMFMVFTHSFSLLPPRWFLSLPISYTPNLLFSHSPDHSPFIFPLSSNHSHFCLVTLFSSDCTLDLPLSFNLFRIHPPLIHSFCDHSHPWSPLFLSIFFNSPSSYSPFLWSWSPLFFSIFFESPSSYSLFLSYFILSPLSLSIMLTSL